MNILLVNPPNCGRSIPEERYGIDSIKQIFRGEPLSIEALAGNLRDHEVHIVDLKVEPDGLADALTAFQPDIVGLTGMTCEANTMLLLAHQVKENSRALVVVGGIHASIDPDFFNRPEVDYIFIGLGKASFREFVTALDNKGAPDDIPGVIETRPGSPLKYRVRKYSKADLVNAQPPAYELVKRYRSHYTLTSLKLDMGFVATAFGCPFRCSFCCIKSVTDGRYLTHSIKTIIRDIELLSDLPVIRLLDANTFADAGHAAALATAIRQANIRKHFLADVRSDTVVNHPELLKQWKDAGLRAVIIGFEEISDKRLTRFKKANTVATNGEAIKILHDMGVTIVGDFIISPEYDETDFDRLENYIESNHIDLPMATILTPLPGTDLYNHYKDNISESNLDYYTLTNAVIPTGLPEQRFYRRYSELIKKGHTGAKL